MTDECRMYCGFATVKPTNVNGAMCFHITTLERNHFRTPNIVDNSTCILISNTKHWIERKYIGEGIDQVQISSVEI